MLDKIIISQPRYLPAINYLQRLYNADLFVFFDTVQRQGRGWENRNKILTNGKEQWVTIPVESSSREVIFKTRISGSDWIDEHKNLIRNAYKKKPFYSDEIVDRYYVGVKETLLKNDFNYRDAIVKMNLNVCDLFGFKPKYIYSSQCDDSECRGVEKLVKISKDVGCGTYVSGANGKEYGVVEAFRDSGINVSFHYFDYPAYPQYGEKEFHPWLSFFDVIFNIGLDRTKNIIQTQWELRNE